jgi:Flp pilus assembly protein TadB
MVRLPAPTPQPIVLAFGVTLLFAGLVTSASVSILGAILFVTGCVGWFREVPHTRRKRRLKSNPKRR